MYIIFFLSDDFVWTKETSVIIFNYFKKYIGFNEAIVYTENEKFINKIKDVVDKYGIYNEDIIVKQYIKKHEEDYRSFIENSTLMLIDESLREEIAYKYIPYSYKGKFVFLK